MWHVENEFKVASGSGQASKLIKLRVKLTSWKPDPATFLTPRPFQKELQEQGTATKAMTEVLMRQMRTELQEI